MGLLALMLMLATPSFAQRSALNLKAKKTSAIEQAKMKAEVMKKHPALAKAQASLKSEKSAFKHTVAGQLIAKRDAALLAGNDGTPLMGNLIYDVNQELSAGIYNITPAAVPQLEEVSLHNYLADAQNGVFIENKFYFSYYISFFGMIFPYHSVYNFETGEFEMDEPGEDLSLVTMGANLAYDQSKDLGYGIFYNAEGSDVEFCSIDFATWTRTTLGKLDHMSDYINMASDGNGGLYGVTASGEIYKIDVNTLQETLVASTGVAAQYIQPSAIDAKTNTLYWAYITTGGGESGLLKVDLTSGEKSFIGTFSSLIELSALYVQGPEAEDAAPARVENLKAYIENEKPNDVKVSFMLPEKTYDGQADLTGMLEFSIYVNKELWVKGSGQPGAAVLRNLENVPSGETTIMVVVRNNVGDGPKAKTTLWVGLDVPKAPETATLTVDEAGNAAVKWSSVGIEGVNGGYVDTDDVTYTVVRYPGGVVVAEGIKGNGFTETVSTDNIMMLSYGVSAVYNEAKGPEARTNAEQVGTNYLTPAGDDFSDENTLGLYSVWDANEDGYTWGAYSGKPAYSYNQNGDADDWLVTAPVKLEAGKLYVFTSSFSTASASYPERIEVMLGAGNDPTGYDVQLIEPTDLAGAVTLKNEFSVAADGLYRVAFHAISDADMWRLMIEGWSISAPIDFGAPGRATDLALTAGAKGALNGVVSFNAPTKTVGGDDLTGTMSVKVTGVDFEQTISDVTPGQAVSVPVEVEESGIYTYTIVASNDKGEGLGVEVSAYIGVDTPGMVNGITGRDNFDGASATFSWLPVTEEGANGGYVDPEQVTYRVYAIDADGYLGDVLAETKDTQYVLFDETINTGDATLVQLAVSAFIGEDEGALNAGALVGGAPQNIPYVETFANGRIDNYWWTNTELGDAWTLAQDDADGDGGCAAHNPSDLSLAYLSTGKISVKGAADPTLLFQWRGLPNMDYKLRVLADRQDGSEPIELAAYDFNNVNEVKWEQAVISLAALTNAEYFVLMFEGASFEPGAFIEFDDLRIGDYYTNDLAAYVSVPRSANVGEEFNATVTVGNLGSEAVAENDYSVLVTLNGKEVANITETQAIPAYTGIVAYNVPITPNLFVESPAVVAAQVVYNRDLDNGNNVAQANINVRQSSLPTVNDLTAETGGWPAVELKWSAPQVQQSAGEIVTEDFENQEIFEPLSVGGITRDVHEGALGEWKLYDGNGIGTYSFNGAPEYTNRYAPMAFIVWNPTTIGIDLTDPSAAAVHSPYSGDQFLVSFCCADEVDGQNVYPASDKWLISPMLSGKAQTISLFTRELVTDYGPELYEVLYSTTDNNLSSFEKLTDEAISSAEWEEKTYDLPAGAKYFAIHVVSQDVWGLMIDDVTFEKAGAMKLLAAADEVTGYNIYRDQELIATVGAEVNSYIDINETDGEHTYYVTAIFGDKESGLSNGATVVTAISELANDSSLQDADITVYATNGAIVASGKGVYNGLAKGVYVIRNNETGAVKGVSKK